MENAEQYSYAAARRAFLGRTREAQCQSHTHPLPGPDGEIAMDTAFWEKRDTDRVLVISSGTHGIEGYCGSFVQCTLLDEAFAERVLEHSSLLMIHGVNPWGFAWHRRVNEDNFDLNRNFIDHTQAHPVNPGYREIAQLLEPEVWHDDTHRVINSALRDAAARHPEDPRWLQSALSAGQYEFPHGQFYGGQKPSWSYQNVLQVAQTYLRGKDVTWIDIHTALGDYGSAECIVESAHAERARSLWGDRVGSMGAEDSVAVSIDGLLVPGMARELGQPIFWTALEYGTLSAGKVITTLMRDQWLHRYGDATSDAGRATKALMMECFNPNDSEWRDAVLNIAREVVGAAL